MLGHDLALALQKYETTYKSLLPPISMLQLIVLSNLETPCLSSEVAEKCGLQAQATRDLLHRMKKRDFIRRVGKTTALTVKGEDVLQRATAIAVRTEDILFANEGITRLDRKRFKDVLRAMTT